MDPTGGDFVAGTVTETCLQFENITIIPTAAGDQLWNGGPPVGVYVTPLWLVNASVSFVDVTSEVFGGEGFGFFARGLQLLEGSTVSFLRCVFAGPYAAVLRTMSLPPSDEDVWGVDYTMPVRPIDRRAPSSVTFRQSSFSGHSDAGESQGPPQGAGFVEVTLANASLDLDGTNRFAVADGGRGVVSVALDMGIPASGAAALPSGHVPRLIVSPGGLISSVGNEGSIHRIDVTVNDLSGFFAGDGSDGGHMAIAARGLPLLGALSVTSSGAAPNTPALIIEASSVTFGRPDVPWTDDASIPFIAVSGASLAGNATIANCSFVAVTNGGSVLTPQPRALAIQASCVVERGLSLVGSSFGECGVAVGALGGGGGQ